MILNLNSRSFEVDTFISTVADENKEGFVRLRVKLDGLKVHSAGIMDRIRGRHPLPKGKNAEIENPTITER